MTDLLDICERARRIGLEALRRAGRPGLPILNHHPTPAVAITNIAASAPQFGCRPSDGWLCGTIAEMKVTYDTLIKAAILLSFTTSGAPGVMQAHPAKAIMICNKPVKQARGRIKRNAEENA